MILHVEPYEPTDIDGNAHPDFFRYRAEVFERGRSHIRRTLREWPYGKVLVTRESPAIGRTTELLFYWSEAQ